MAPHRSLESPGAGGALRLLGLAAGLALLVATGGLWAQEAQYTGVAKCKACHKSQFEIWEKSPHSGAFESLSAEEQKKDECLACHQTGFGKPAAAGAVLAGVQCESCHGPGSLYKKISIMSKSKYKADPEGQRKAALEAGLVLPDETTCTACHNEKSPQFKGFDYEEYLARIKHWDLE